MITRRQAMLGAVCLPVGFPAFAFSPKQITLIVPFAPGASADGISRILGSFLSERLGIPVVIENKAGGGGSLGLVSVSRSISDGSTIGVGATGAIAINPHSEGTAAFDPQKNLTPIAKLIDIPLVLISKSDSNLKTVGDVVSASKFKMGGLSYGSTGTNSAQHLSIEILKNLTGANLTHVPYRGSAPAVTDVLAGQVPLACVDLTSASEHIKAKTLLAIGTTAAKRYVLASEIPAFAEQGLKDFDVPAWIGMFGPAGMNQDIVNQLSDHFAAGLSNAAVKMKVEQLQCAPSYLTSEEFRTFIRAQSEVMRSMITAGTIR